MKFDSHKGDRGWVRDADGILLPCPVRGDTETGVVECIVIDAQGSPVHDWEAGRVKTEIGHFKPPLTITPIDQEPAQETDSEDTWDKG